MKYFNIHKLLKLADFVTLANAASGMLAIMFAFFGRFKIAISLIVLAMIFDFLDGKIARLKKHATVKKELGMQLDSLADVISFGVAPAMIGFFVGLRTWWGITILVIYVLCGVLRLARFNVTAKKIKGFQGLPITAAGFIVAVLFFGAIYVPEIIQFMPAVYVVLALAMISSISVKKI